MAKKITVEQAIEVLHQSGLPTYSEDYVLKTFQVEPRVLMKFMTAVRKNDLKVCESVTEALSDWVKKAQKQ